MSPRDALLQLTGLAVEDGWSVGEHLQKQPDQTGGFFSECYRASHASGREGHFKAIDLHGALDSDDVLGALIQLADGAKCEQELLEKCRGLDRVVTMLAFGTIRELNGQRLSIPIPYLIFERANGTVQQVTNAAARPSQEWCMRTLHH